MQNKLLCTLLLSMLSTFSLANASPSLTELADTELSTVEGSGIQVTKSADNATHFAFDKETTNAGLIQASGDLKVLDSPLPSSPLINNNNILNLSDNAQSHLNSIVNVNAVNSVVQVLLNLNISINSQIGSLIQGNKASSK